MITLQERVHGTKTPSDWKLNKLHRVFRVRKGYKNIGMRENNLLSLSYGHIINKDIDSADGLLPESFETYQIVEPGNIVMRLTDLQNDKRSLRQGLVKERGIITSAYDALELERGHDPRFWAYALLALDLAKYYYSLGGGVRQSIKFADFPNDWIAVPSAMQQSKIADFLDKETNRIDTLIEKKNKLVSTINERQEAKARNLLTGANISGSRQPSRNPWIDSIPSSWREKRLSWCFSTIGSGTTPSANDYERYYGLGTPWVTTGELREKAIKSTKHQVTKAALAEHSALKIYPKGSLIMAMYGATIGRLGWLETPAALNQACCAFAKPQGVDTRFIFHWLKSFRNDLISLASGGGQPNINQEKVRSLRIGVPEQEEVARQVSIELDKEAAHVSRIESSVSNSIGRLREFRTAIITAAVTGQIDVTSWGRGAQTDHRLDEIQEAMGA